MLHLLAVQQTLYNGFTNKKAGQAIFEIICPA
jgi:hypothetical protein